MSQCDKPPSSCNIDVFMIHVFCCSLLNCIYMPMGFCRCATYKPHPHVFTISVNLCRIPPHFIRSRKLPEIFPTWTGNVAFLGFYKVENGLVSEELISSLYYGKEMLGVRAKSPAVDTHSHCRTGCYSIVRLVSLLETRE